MTASSPVTMEDLVNGLIITDSNGNEWNVEFFDQDYKLTSGSDAFNVVRLSSDGLTITFGAYSGSGPTFTGFTFNA